MKKNTKNLIYISIAFSISFIILGTFMDSYSKGSLTNQIIIDVENQNKIFLVGTSYVAVLNSTHIETSLNEHGFKRSIYGLESDNIPDTLDDIERIISHKPELIVFGVGYRDIGYMENEVCSHNEIPPYVSNTNDEITNSGFEDNLNSFIRTEKNMDQNIFDILSQNPKQMTVNILYSFFGETKKQFIESDSLIDNRLALSVFKPNTITPISSLNEITAGKYCMDFEKRNDELNNLDRIFKKLDKNQIDVIVYIPPYTNGYLKTLSPSLQKELISNIKSISEKYDFTFYNLSSTWEYSDIFSDRTHVAFNPRSLVYSHEISSIIISNTSKDFSQ
jgi:hypothetical protein